MNLSIAPTRGGFVVEGVLYEHLDSGKETPLADIPAAEIPALASDSDSFESLLECLVFWCHTQSRHADTPMDVYLPFGER